MQTILEYMPNKLAKQNNIQGKFLGKNWKQLYFITFSMVNKMGIIYKVHVARTINGKMWKNKTNC